MSKHDLLVAASTIWVVITAVLVMFMQAGFAFLEAGLTRMKNAGHIAGKNVLIFGICSIVYWAIGFALAFGDGNSIIGTDGFFPSVTSMLSVGAKPWDWFSEIPGAAGYLLIRLGDWALPGVLIGALLAAGLGWYLVARFLGLVLAGEREMDPDDYRLEGTVGQVTVSIPAGGTGEVMFAKAGARRSEAARATGGGPIPRGSEVVITTYADGFATVQPWGEFLAARDKLAVPENREA